MEIDVKNIRTAQEICELLHIKRNTLYSKRWRKASQIPVFRQGKYLFGYKDTINKWYQQRAIINV